MYRVLMTDYWKKLISKDVSFNESSRVLENLDEASTSRVNFELPCLQSEYFGEAVSDSVEKAAAEEPNIAAHYSVQEADSFVNEEERNTEWEDPLDPFTYYPELRHATQYTSGVPPECLNYDSGFISSVVRDCGHLTGPFHKRRPCIQSTNNIGTRLCKTNLRH